MTTFTIPVSAGALTLQIPDGFILTSSGSTLTISAPPQFPVTANTPTPKLDSQNPLGADYGSIHHKIESTPVDPAYSQSQLRNPRLG